ncbi:uncharacterized protein F21D5.5 [Copidosoma floridanum]|uniref:uncharacterized protein F21D5.5 n=1 Tax=Copidosoma floridanum TaxID=29053 RepID=UPI000C6FB9C3|nr:uncharacterized protein F21D5.5 [Copidosoma floridanum]
MTSQVDSCYIYSEDKKYSSVYLPDKEEVFVGRSADTKIEDLQCSRQHVSLYASYKDRKVFVEQVGKRPCCLSGFKTERGVRMIAQHGDRLEILYGKYPYRIEFNPPTKIKTKSEKPKLTKRLLSQESDEEEDDSKTGNNLKKAKVMATNDEENLCMASTSSADSNTKSGNSTKEGIWETFGNNTLYVYTSSGCEGRSKIAAYDMDKTLIKTISGLEFPKDSNDWQLLYPEVPGKLKKFYTEGYKIVILSNQNGLGTGKVTLKDFKIKIERIVKKIGVPMQVFLAVGQSIYRKPRVGMWTHLVNEKNDGVPVEKENSFYVGDAAGRPADSSRKKKDHSLVDRLMALNLNLTFSTPEEHFLGHKKAPFNSPSFHPKEASKNTVLHEPPNTKIMSDMQELVIMVGCQGSGKSHFARTHLKNYCYVNRDSLGSWQKCIAKTEEFLEDGKSVVVDNTNPDKTSRQRYIEVAKKRNIPVRCFMMNLNKEHIKHNNMFRILTDPTHQVISDMLINSFIDPKFELARRCIRFMQLLILLCLRIYISLSIRFPNIVPTSYRKNFIPPSQDEGFSEIVKINFVPAFTSEEDRRLYEMYLLG